MCGRSPGTLPSRLCGLTVLSSSIPPRRTERGKQDLVQAYVAPPANERFGEGILGRLARCDVVPFDAGLLAPAQDRRAGELGAVVGDAGEQPARAGSRDNRSHFLGTAGSLDGLDTALRLCDYFRSTCAVVAISSDPKGRMSCPSL
jgi:hypothetical protein